MALRERNSNGVSADNISAAWVGIWRELYPRGPAAVGNPQPKRRNGLHTFPVTDRPCDEVVCNFRTNCEIRFSVASGWSRWGEWPQLGNIRSSVAGTRF